MRLPRTSRSSGDSIVPMINVAFLLLVFFLMTAVLAPPEPFDVAPPVATGREAEVAPDTLVISAEGDLALGAARGDAVYDVLPDGPLRIRSDAGLEGATLARIVGRLGELGVSRIELITVPR